MNGDSFANLEQYERMPLRKWLKLLNAHNEITEERNAAIREAANKS